MAKLNARPAKIPFYQIATWSPIPRTLKTNVKRQVLIMGGGSGTQ